MTIEQQDIDDGLTDEERAALAEDDETETEKVTDDTETEAGKPAESGEPAAEPAAKPAAEPEPVAQAKPESAPLLVAPAPEDAEGKLRDIADQKEALLTQFDDGDITAREYQKKLDDISRSERAIERAQDQAELAVKLDRQKQQNDWVSLCGRFIESNPTYRDNSRLYRALDAEVRDLATKAETANWTGEQFLEAAHKNLQEAFGFSDAAKPGTKVVAAKQRADLPPNLAKVPAAEVQDTNGGRFAVLDRLANTDPIAYEEAVKALSKAERNAYLAA